MHIYIYIYIYIYVYMCVCVCVHTHTQTPRNRILLKKQTGIQLVKKFPAFYGTRRFITTFNTACHRSLSCARSIQSMPHISSSSTKSSLYYLPTYALFVQTVSPPNSVFTTPLPHTCYMHCPSHSS